MSARVTACACVHACVHEYAHKDIVTLTSVVEGLAAKCLDVCMTCARNLDARAELSAQSMYRLMFICGLKCDHDDKDSGQRAHAVDFVNRLSALGIAVVDRLLAKGQRGAVTRTAGGDGFPPRLERHGMKKQAFAIPNLDRSPRGSAGAGLGATPKP